MRPAATDETGTRLAWMERTLTGIKLPRRSGPRRRGSPVEFASRVPHRTRPEATVRPSTESTSSMANSTGPSDDRIQSCRGVSEPRNAKRVAMPSHVTLLTAKAGTATRPPVTRLGADEAAWGETCLAKVPASSADSTSCTKTPEPDGASWPAKSSARTDSTAVRAASTRSREMPSALLNTT